MSDPAALRQRLAQLERAPGSGDLPAQRTGVLSECAFRLAVHPATPAAEALRLLQRAARIDGANPKYAYHLARWHFLHGDLHRAGAWLLRADRLCPTSHRVRAHLSVLQKELSERCAGDSKVALRKRGDGLAESVQRGDEDVLPEWLLLTPPTPDKDKDRDRKKEVQQQEARMEPQGDSQAQPESEAPDTAGPPRQRRRVLDSGRCRWSGIHDLLAEEVLEDEASDDSLKKLKQRLEQVRELAPRRRGGVAAFAILGIEWLVAGYPAGPVRVLAAGLPPAPSLEMLSLVAALMELDPKELPRRLATELAAGHLPPLLAAVIHKRRLLWHPFRLRTLGVACRAGSRFLERPGPGHPGAQAQSAEEHAQRIVQASAELEASPRRPIEDAPDEAAAPALSAQDARGAFETLEAAARELEKFWAQAFELLKRRLLPAADAADPSQREQLLADGRAAESAFAALKEAADEGSRRLERILGVVKDEQAAIQDLPTRTESVKRQLNKLRDRVRPLDSLQKKLEKIAGTAPPAGTSVSPDLEGLFAAIGAALPLTVAARDLSSAERIGELAEQAPAAATAPAAAATAATAPAAGMALLAWTLEDVKRRVRKLFEAAHDSFASYSEQALAAPELNALRLSLLAREAEAFYRLGERDEARRSWIRLLREDRLNVAGLRNVAVCDTTGPQIGREQASWRAYAETLYFLDIVSGRPDDHAAERAALHRNLAAAALGPVLLKRPERQEDWDDQELAEFLGSPGRLRGFVGHKLLELLNVRLALTSPTALLGVLHEEGQPTREKGRERMRAFLDECEPLVPLRVRAAFCDLVRNRLEQAHEECRDVRRLARRRNLGYREQEQRLLHWLVDVIVLKFTLVTRIIGQTQEPVRPRLAERLHWVGCAVELARLDAVPLDPSRKALLSAATELSLDAPEQWVGMMGMVKGRLLRVFLEKGQVAAALPVLADDLAAEGADAQQAAAMLGALHRLAEDDDRATLARLDLPQLASAAWTALERARGRLAEGGKGDGNPTAGELDQLEHQFGMVLANVCVLLEGGGKDRTPDLPAAARRIATVLARATGFVSARFVRAQICARGAQEAFQGRRLEEGKRLLREARSDAKMAADRGRDPELRAAASKLLSEIDEALKLVG